MSSPQSWLSSCAHGKSCQSLMVRGVYRKLTNTYDYGVSDILRALSKMTTNGFPDDEDLSGTVDALLRLQDLYQLRPEQISSGHLYGDVASPVSMKCKIRAALRLKRTPTRSCRTRTSAFHVYSPGVGASRHVWTLECGRPLLLLLHIRGQGGTPPGKAKHGQINYDTMTISWWRRRERARQKDEGIRRMWEVGKLPSTRKQNMREEGEQTLSPPPGELSVCVNDT